MRHLDCPATIFEMFSTVMEQHADSPAFTFLDDKLQARDYSFRILQEASAAGAEKLRRYGFPDNSPVGILVQSQESQVVHYLAVLEAGLVPAILTPPNRKLRVEIFEETIIALVEQCQFSAIITDMAELNADVRLLEPWTLDTLRESHRPPAVLDTTAILQFTSGTTGIKRGVQISHAAMQTSLQIYSKSLGLDRRDIILSWLPLYHDMGFIACLNMPLAFGVHCVMIQPLDWVAGPALFVQAASRYRATLSWNPNFAYAFMADRIGNEQLQGIDLSSLRGLINCAEPVTAESQRRFCDRFTPFGLRENVFRGCYAMAETTFALTDGQAEDGGYLDLYGPQNADISVRLPQVSVGSPLPGVELEVMDSVGVPVAERHFGELWVKGRVLFSGYFNNPDTTAAVMHEGWYKTGDCGYRIGNEFYVCSRKKDLLILNGVNIFPQDVEDLVSSVAGIIPGRSVAFSQFNEQLQSEMLIVVAECDVTESAKADIIVRIRQLIMAQLQPPGFLVSLVPPKWLVKSSSGKIARQANRAKWAKEYHSSEVSQAN
ncbi:MAG: AMP-binding protein [Desulfuromonadales bacterium]